MLAMGVAADMGAALAPEAGRRSRTHAQASSCRPARLLCPPHHQRRRGGSHSLEWSWGCRPAATATGRTSRPPSTSIAVASTSTLKPAQFPDEPF